MTALSARTSEVTSGLLAEACLRAMEGGKPPQASKYYRARYYDPKLARFLSEDPIELRGGINFYAYVNNAPLVSRDPSGRDPGQFGQLAVVGGGTIGTVIAGSTLPAWVGPAVIVAGVVVTAAAAYELLVKPHLTEDTTDERAWKQDKKLTPGEIKKLKENDIDPEALKGGRKTGELDLYKDPKGNIVTKPKGGSGPGEPTGININNLRNAIPDPCP